jgi:regulation of enolase protein 1 (concanavalin A-like superfamily)/ribosomal protein S18 acetylase RimI-like enzyme
MDSQITLRRVQASDAPALYTFYNQLSQASKRTFAPFGANPALANYEDVVQGNLASPADKYDLVALVGECIVGWGFVWTLAAPEPVFGLGVADEYHGKGVGGQLMDAVLDAMRQRSMRWVYLTVVTDNFRAWQMYGRRGFMRYGAFTGADGLPYYRMVADLQSASVPREIDHMQWLHEPHTWNAQNNMLRVTTDPKTDFWRKTHYGFVRDNGHFYGQPVTGNFVAEVKVSGEYRDLYDHAGLMVRLDETTWIKCGVEFVNNAPLVSAVVTHDYSDWSVTPAPRDLAALWLRLIRHGDAIEIHYSYDGEHYAMLRMAHLTLTETVSVGPMCASPEGNGFNVAFEDYSVRPAP